MSVAKQLCQLQEIDLAIEASEQALSQVVRQLGDNEVVARARGELAAAHQHLEELKHQQQSAEWDIDDISNKISVAEGKLYSGRIGNPKELSSLQQEVESFKTKRSQLEEKVLILMEQVDLAVASVTTKSSELKRVEAEWQRQQQELSSRMAQLKNTLSELNRKRQLLSANIARQALELYTKLKKQKKPAVAQVEQGICRGCRISLSTAELQQTRAGTLVQCSSCGRILFSA